MKEQLREGTQFTQVKTYIKGLDGKYRGEITVPLNLYSLGECLAKSILLTVYKPESGMLYTTYENFDSLTKDKYDTETYNMIKDCQVIFARCIEYIPLGIYRVGHIHVVVSNITHIGKAAYKTLDSSYYLPEIKERIEEYLEKAAIIVEGMFHFTTSGKFTDKCLTLIEEYRAMELLEG